MAAPDWLTARPVAHRGLHDFAAGRVENTLTAIRAAVARNFAIEVDLQLTGDGDAVVHHDEHLGRLVEGDAALDTLSVAELKAARFKTTDDVIPTFAELLETVAGKVPLIIELKSTYPTQADDRLARRSVELLKGYGGPAALMSFDPQVVEAVKRLDPTVVRGIVADDCSDEEHYGHLPAWQRYSLKHLLHVPRTAPDFVAYCVNDLPTAATSVMRRMMGKPLLTWTVRTPDQRQRAADHADQMIFEGFDPEA